MCGIAESSSFHRFAVCSVISRRLGETAANANTSHEDNTIVLEAQLVLKKHGPVDNISSATTFGVEAYDFGGQEVYYAMHHLFLSASWRRLFLSASCIERQHGARNAQREQLRIMAFTWLASTFLPSMPSALAVI